MQQTMLFLSIIHIQYKTGQYLDRWNLGKKLKVAKKIKKKTENIVHASQIA